MSRLDDRLTTELERAARPADPPGSSNASTDAAPGTTQPVAFARARWQSW